MNLLIRKYISEILLILIWIITIFIVNPWGEFPINDDWAYAKAVQYLTHEGIYKMGNWPAMTLFAQTLWGSLFCKIFGFSFNVLRISTIVSSIINTFLVYFLLKEITKNNKLSFFTCLLWFSNPIYFNLSFTFMTEVHFLTFTIASIYFYYQYLKESKMFYILIGTFFALAATLTRQQGVILPFAFGIIFVMKSEKNIKNFIVSFLPFMVVGLSLFGFVSWLEQNHNLSYAYGKTSVLMKVFFEYDFYFFYSRLGLIFFYIGLLFLPVVFLMLPYFKTNNLKTKIIFIVIASAIIIPAMDRAWGNFPSGNTIYNLGLGPKLLKHTNSTQPVLSNKIWDVIRLFCMASVIILPVLISEQISNIVQFIKNKKLSNQELIKMYAVILFFAFLIFTIINPIFFDRYSLPLVLFLLIIVVPFSEKFSFIKSGVGVLFFLFFFSFSILFTHDYFSWNRARWEALNYLMKEKNIKPTEIDGGFEFNGWFLSETNIFPDASTGKSWWFVHRDDYVISSTAVLDFKEIKAFPYERYISPRNDFVYILWHQSK